jgi:hypothetical protein
MRELTVKWATECKKCGASLDVGVQAMYEKSMGLFCVGHEPKGVEEIRRYRTEKAEVKAARYDEWAEKREVKAEAALNSFPSMRHDWAFITQPGHIPARARMNAADDRALESLKVAEGMRSRAEGIRNVRVAGDAERKREKIRAALDTMIGKGSQVHDAVFGLGTVVGVYPKSYRIRFDRLDRAIARDKAYVRPIKPITSPREGEANEKEN